MRGIAALVVILYHTRAAPFAQGYLGVDFFFFLSGFVLAHVYGTRFARSLQQTGRFLWLRLCRIYPVHAFTTLALLPNLGSGIHFSEPALAMSLLLLQVLLPYGVFNDLAWSVSAEWIAYLAFPFLALGLARLRREGYILVAVVAAAVWYGTYISGPVRLGLPALGRTFPEFVMGMLLYRLYAEERVWAILRSDRGFVVITVAILVSAGLGAPDPIIVALLPLLLLSAAENGGLVAVILNSRPLTKLGEASYSIYLAQSFALILIGGAAMTPIGRALGLHGLQAVMVAGSVSFGFLLHRCVERPCREAMRGWPDALMSLSRSR